MTTCISAKRQAFVIAAVAVATTMFVPARAQTPARQSYSSNQYEAPTLGDGYRAAAAAVNAQRGEAFRRGNSAGVAQIYTPDAVYVELLPRLEVMRGRAEIKKHFDDLLAAHSSNLTFTVTSAELTANDTMSAGGDYVLTAGRDKRIQGHFYQVLRRDGATWKIAMHVFARPEPVTVGEVDSFRGN